MKKKKKPVGRGGHREGSGRKPADDKNHPITIQVRESAIEKIGSKEKVKEIAQEAVDSAAMETQQS